MCGHRFEGFTCFSPELLCGLTREQPGRPKVSGDGAGVRERSHNPDQAMTRTDKILTAMGGVFVVIGAVAVSAAPITPARFNPAVEAQANRGTRTSTHVSISSTTLMALPLSVGRTTAFRSEA